MGQSRWIKILIAACAMAMMPLALAGPAAAATTPDALAAPMAVPGTSGAIGAKYASLAGAKGPLGVATTVMQCNLVRGGCYQRFVNGSIYWSPVSGAHTVTGGIRAKWGTLGWEHGFLGYPTGDAICGLVAGGCYQNFQDGKMYYLPATGAQPVKGAIGGKWGQMGYEQSPLSYPAGGEACTGTGNVTCTQKFLGGSIRWNSIQGVSVAPNAGTIAAVVNKRRPNVPLGQVPQDLVQVGSQLMRREAAGAMSRLIGGAAAAGVPVTTVSGYRSYATQSNVYYSYVAAYGRAYADTISARPGFSEHQLGLVMDIGNPNGACGLQTCFANTPAGIYAASNAWRYGFIVRYTNGYTSITGYTFEPWHLRYVGLKIATDMHNRGARTLEQYFGMPAAPSY